MIKTILVPASGSEKDFVVFGTALKGLAPLLLGLAALNDLLSKQARSNWVHDLTGQLFGVRGRELLLFSQPRPVARTLMSAGTAWDESELARAINGELVGGLTDLATDLEFFNTEPIV